MQNIKENKLFNLFKIDFYAQRLKQYIPTPLIVSVLLTLRVQAEFTLEKLTKKNNVITYHVRLIVFVFNY
jgi:hypothetical protein